MNQLPNPAYLIVVEIERKGFLIDIVKSKAQSEVIAEKLVEISVSYPFADMYKVEQELTYFASYTMNGTQVYLGKFIYHCSNGSYSVSTLQIDLNTFCVQTFIRERENQSSVLAKYACDENDETDPRYDRLLDLFPNLYTLAN
jgi:hypothetical protein